MRINVFQRVARIDRIEDADLADIRDAGNNIRVLARVNVEPDLLAIAEERREICPAASSM
jgi:hypothetical protein